MRRIFESVLVAFALVGCGKHTPEPAASETAAADPMRTGTVVPSANAGDSKDASPRAANRLTSAKEEEVKRGMQLVGFDVPTDGGPIVVYGSTKCVPGAITGPCVDEKCGHRLCGDARRLAAQSCALCNQRLGFGAQIEGLAPIRWNRTSGRALFHGSCWPQQGCKCERCGVNFMPLMADVVDGKFVHVRQYCDNVLARQGRPIP